MPHPLRGMIVKALKEANATGPDDPLATAAAIRSVLDARPELGISEAYELVRTLWLR